MKRIKNRGTYTDGVDGTQFLHEEREIKGHGMIMIDATWNNAERWGELAVFTPYGNWGHRWESVSDFGMALRSNWDYLMEKLMGRDGIEEIDMEATLRVLTSECGGDKDMFCDLKGCDDETALWCWAERWNAGNISRFIQMKMTERAQWMKARVVPAIQEIGTRLPAAIKTPAMMTAGAEAGEQVLAPAT